MGNRSSSVLDKMRRRLRLKNKQNLNLLVVVLCRILESTTLKRGCPFSIVSTTRERATIQDRVESSSTYRFTAEGAQ